VRYKLQYLSKKNDGENGIERFVKLVTFSARSKGVVSGPLGKFLLVHFTGALTTTLLPILELLAY